MHAKSNRVRPLGPVAIDKLDPAMFAGDGEPRDTANQDDIIHDNTRKAGFAATAINAYAAQVGGGYETFHALIGDFFADLHHLADALDIDLAAAISEGRDDYLAEIGCDR